MCRRQHRAARNRDAGRGRGNQCCTFPERAGCRDRRCIPRPLRQLSRQPLARHAARRRLCDHLDAARPEIHDPGECGRDRRVAARQFRRHGRRRFWDAIRALLASVATAIEAVRPVGSILCVRPPTMVQAAISLTITVAGAAQKPPVAAAVGGAIAVFVNALPIGAPLPLTRIAQVAYAAHPAVTNVSQVLVNGSRIRPRAARVRRGQGRPGRGELRCSDQPSAINRTCSGASRRCCPRVGSPTRVPVLDGVLSGLAAGWAWLYGLLGFVMAQTRIATATGVWLDMIARDCFGTRLSRRGAQADDAFRARSSASCCASAERAARSARCCWI